MERKSSPHCHLLQILSQLPTRLEGQGLSVPLEEELPRRVGTERVVHNGAVTAFDYGGHASSAHESTCTYAYAGVLSAVLGALPARRSPRANRRTSIDDR